MNYLVRTVSVVALAAVLTACASPEQKKAKKLDAGNALAAQKKYAEAIIEYKNAIKIDQQFGEAHLQLAKAYEETKDYARALKSYVRAADLMPENADVQLAAARLLVLAGKFEDAKARAEGVLARDPKNVPANLVVGSALVGLKDVDGAIKQVEDAVALDPLEGSTQTTLGVLQLAKGDLARAESAFNEAVRLKPQSIEARVSLASFLWMQKRMPDAENELKAALALDPKNVLVNRALAAFYMQSSRPNEAEPYMKTVADTGDPRARLALADYYIALKRVDEAGAMLKAMEADKSFGPIATVRLALLAYGQKKTAEAHAMIDALIDRGGETAQAQLVKGRFLLAEGRIDQAVEVLRAAVKADAKLAGAQYLLGNALSAKNDLAGAAEAYRATLELAPAAVPAQLQLARVSLLRGDPASSLSAATTALDKQPDNPTARILLIDALLAKPDLPRAAEEIARLKAKYPKAATVWALEGKLRGGEGNLADASRAFNQALSLDPNSVDALVGLAGVDLAQGNAASALVRVETVLQKRPGDPAIRMIAARAYQMAKDLPKAQATLEALIVEHPSHVKAMGMLGDIYMAQGKQAQALERYQALAAIEPKSVAAHTMIGIIHQGQKRLPDAKKSYETALEVNPDAAIAANNLAWMLADERQDLDRALTLAKRAESALPNDPQVSDTIGWIYYQKQLPALAVAPFERAVSLDPRNAEFQYHLGLAYARVGDNAKARTHLQKALAIDAKFNGATEARGLLSSLGTE